MTRFLRAPLNKPELTASHVPGTLLAILKSHLNPKLSSHDC
jgi:hypothetical protein